MTTKAQPSGPLTRASNDELVMIRWLSRTFVYLTDSASARRPPARADRQVVHERRLRGRILLIASPACSAEDTAVHAAAATATGNTVNFVSIVPPDPRTRAYLTALRDHVLPGRLIMLDQERDPRPVPSYGALVCATPRGVYEADGSFSALPEPRSTTTGWRALVDLYAR